MLSEWERIINVPPISKVGDEEMTLESILSTVAVSKGEYSLNEQFPTIRRITDEEYRDKVYEYIMPKFEECKSNCVTTPKFLLFSAPGATGKTALALYVCHTKNAIYWDLPEIKVAEFSFNGAIQKAVGVANVSGFIRSMEKGENFLVIDAFDEAEAGSGRSGIEFFLRDLNDMTAGCTGICAILMARTESAIFIKKYLDSENIPYMHYQVGLFEEYNAKYYVETRIKKFGLTVNDVVKQCITEQFNEIKRIFNGKEGETFLGYAPVLEALAASYDDERNTLNLLKHTQKGENSCSLMLGILGNLLTREQKKFTDAVAMKIPKMADVILESKVLYDDDEQIRRLFGKILIDDCTLFADINELIPMEYREDYLNTLDIQLPQHPYIVCKDNKGEKTYDFVGAAFRDYVIAYSLANETLKDFVRDYLSENIKYCPSQMLIEFYGVLSGNKISGRNIALMYESFKSSAQSGDRIVLYINGNREDCSAEFVRICGKDILSSIVFEIVDLEDGIYLNQLSNCYIDVDGDVVIGNVDGEARISNSTIECNKIVWSSEQVSIEAYSPGECILIFDRIDCTLSTLPRFEIKVDDKKNFKVFSPALNNYYKLLAYKCNNVEDEDSNNFSSFATVIRRLLSCLRSHSKDVPARKTDFIDNRIISTSMYKKRILAFLLDKHILYKDDQDWLYKLDVSMLTAFEIKWHDVREGEFDSLKLLYNEFVRSL